MFTLEQIHAAHSKVKSGADFPSYIQELKALGLTRYVVDVSDGHVTYYGTNDYALSVPPKYETLVIPSDADIEHFTQQLKAHQQGKTDYITFIADCVACGIASWSVCLDNMTCTYFNKTGDIILEENIPQA